MTTPSEYRTGDRVESPVGMPGFIIRADRASVTARYVDYRKSAWETTYTAEWFKAWPQMLRKLPPLPTAARR